MCKRCEAVKLEVSKEREALQEIAKDLEKINKEIKKDLEKINNKIKNDMDVFVQEQEDFLKIRNMLLEKGSECDFIYSLLTPEQIATIKSKDNFTNNYLN